VQGISLYMQPQTPPMTWGKFCNTIKPFAVAIDGFVSEGPAFEASGPWANFNHHEGVSRLETRATCAQVLLAVRQGFFKSFRKDGGPYIRVYANDCDEDVCLSWMILNNSHVTSQIINPLLNRLVYMEDMLDTTAGAYPFPTEMPSFRELNWIFEPYRRVRLGGLLDQRDASCFTGVVYDVENRINAYLAGKGRELPFDTRYEVIDGGRTWKLVHEIGFNARLGLFADSIDAFVAVRERPNNCYSYTLGRRSQFVPFPIPEIVERCNRIENCTDDRWGGGITTAGSPRIAGSKITPKELTAIVEEETRLRA
jgi:hypothetical protein